MREKLLKDSAQLADYEILELLLGLTITRRDTKPLAKELLARFKTVRGVFRAQLSELKQADGFGPALEAQWILLREFYIRINESSLPERMVLDSPDVVADLGMARLGGLLSEEFWLAMVDNRNRLMAWERVSQGTVDQAPVYPREVLSLALERKASGIIMVHNHPGGNPKPSNQDMELTKRISRAAQDLGVRMLDHIIVTADDYFSFQAQGML